MGQHFFHKTTQSKFLFAQIRFAVQNKSVLRTIYEHYVKERKSYQNESNA